MTSTIKKKSNEKWTGYWNGDMTAGFRCIGTGQIPSQYDCAIAFEPNSEIVGEKTIEGIKFCIPDASIVENVKVWISTSLPYTADEADIVCQDVVDVTDLYNTADPVNEIRFSKPYKYDASKTVYVGYSFMVTSGFGNDAFDPVPCDVTQGDQKNALYAKFGEEGEWFDYDGYGFGRLAMQVLVSGKFASDDAIVKPELGSYVASKNDMMSIPVEIESNGTNKLKKVSGTVEMNGETSNLTIQIPEGLSLGEKTVRYVNINAPAEAGSYYLNIKIDKANGVAMAKPSEGKAKIFIASRTAKRVPLFEGFTATSMSTAPRAYIAFEKLRDVYADDIAIVDVHINDDEMQTHTYDGLLSTITDWPCAHVDRRLMGVDPYFGDTYDYFGIRRNINDRINVAPIAEVDARGVIDGDELTVTSETRFLFTGDASDFALGYVITEDGLHSEQWYQQNIFSGMQGSGEDVEPLFQFWVDGDPMISDVVYNDVAIVAEGITRGIRGSIPASVENEAVNTHSISFNLSDYPVIQDKEKLNAVVVLFNISNGEVLNADFIRLGNGAGIDGIDADDENVKPVARYTADGRRISAPERGVNIIRYSDGSSKKIVVD